MDELLSVRDLEKHYEIKTGVFGKGRLRAVDRISFDIARGETMGLVGESGCGKSTTARCILRLVEPTSGRILFDGFDLMGASGQHMRALRKRMQMVFQDPCDSLNPRMTVRQVLEEPLKLNTDMSLSQRRERTEEFLSIVGLRPEHMERFPHQLSGGQRQRVGVGRAMIMRPDFVVLDEPTSALDVSVRGKILLLLNEMQERFSVAYLFISHDLSIIRHTCRRVAVMYLGVILEKGPVGKVFDTPLNPYTKALMSVIPIPDPSVKRERILLEGEVPSPVNLPPGCRFSFRCPSAIDICKESEPVLSEVEADHWVACHLV